MTKRSRKKRRVTKAKEGRGLSLKQRAFVLALVGEAKGNAAEAARLAGYRSRTPQGFARVGEENRRKPEIAKALDEALAKLEAAGMATAAEVHTFLTTTMRGKTEHFEVGPTGAVVEVAPPWKVRVTAAAELAKVLGMATKKVEVEHTGAAVSFVFEDNGRGPTSDQGRGD